jgi:signal transduction histidine kinase
MQKNETVNDERRELVLIMVHQIARYVPPSIIAIVDIIKDMIAEDRQEDAAPHIKLLKKTAYRTRRYVRWVTALSKDIDVTRELISVMSLIETAIRATKDELKDHVEPVTTSIDPSMVVYTSKMWMSHVIENLIENANDNIPETISGQIHLSAEPVNNRVQIRVKDNGIGIPESEQETIFDLGKSGDPEERAMKGFGLYYCRRIIVELGGQIEVKSVPHEGATFIISLPASDGDNTYE